jgi:hypothetical protein
MTQGDWEPEETDEPEEHVQRPIDRWRHNTAAGAVAASVALGLQQVFDPEKKKDTVAIEQEAPGEPHDPGPVDLHFDPNDRAATYVVIRQPPEE